LVHLKWKKAMKEEFQGLKKTGTFELVPLPKGNRTIGTRWLFKLKRRADGTIDGGSELRARVKPEGQESPKDN